MPRIERRIQPCSGADFEDAVARLNSQALDRLDAPRLERKTERNVIDGREVGVHAIDERVADCRDREWLGMGGVTEMVVPPKGNGHKCRSIQRPCRARGTFPSDLPPELLSADDE